MITESLKESIIAEKLTTKITYRALGLKYKLKFQTVHQWVQEYQGKVRNRKSEKKVKATVAEEELKIPIRKKFGAK
jgi:transposase-like protein